MAAPCDDPLLAGLHGDAEIARHLDAAAAVAAMVRFEAALARVEARLGVIPAAAGPAISAALETAAVPPDSLAAGAASAGVPVPALVAALRRIVGAPHGDFVHWGATSQDAMDTGLVLRLRPALALLEGRLLRLADLLLDAAGRHAALPMAARTRSQLAVPTTLGLRIAGWAAPLLRCLDRLAELRPRLLVVQLGGAAGTLSVFGARGPQVMAGVAAELGLGCPAKPWHTERDAIVELGGWLAMVCGLTARIGADLLLLGRSEIGELAAGTGGGSSTMPQKANPVLAETLVTLGRVTAAQAGALHGALVHVEERDGAAWGVEWSVLPQMLVATGVGLRHAAALAADLRPAPARMAATLAQGGGAVEAEALAFGLARQVPLPEAQAMVKAAAVRVAAQGGTLAAHLAADCAARGLMAPDPGGAGAQETVAALIGAVRAHRDRLR